MKHTATQYRRWAKNKRKAPETKPDKDGPDLCFTCAGTKVYKGKPCPDCLETEATPS